MAVVRNLMIRIGADYSAARKSMQGATRELTKFKNDATRTMNTVKGKKGLGGISTEFRNLGNTVTSSLSQIRGAKGIGGVTSALGSLRPMMGSATKGLGALGAGAAGAGAAFGGAALGIGAFVAALALATVGIYQASQTAVKFEADLGRLNMQLGGNSREFMDWARSMGLAKTTATEMGATYGTLLSSFIKDNNELANQTKQIVQMTRVVASATGRSIQDVTERMRSGLLGNTEAIEDLGIFVNVSMIESTEAFRKFAGDKSWEQLTFQQQQQIRLAAILEQAYKRYGNDLQNNVMTKQERLMEQFKDIKLHLSQMFLPLWDAVLPALTRFGEALAWVTEQLARFFYAIRGWDYDEMTRGSDKATDAINDQTDAYDELAESAKKAVKQLAAFDEINQLGDFGGGSTGGGNGSGSGGIPAPPGGTPDGGVNWDWPQIPPELTKRYRIEFDPPQPPDAGMGAVATAVISTVDGMNAETKAKMAQMWGDLHGQTQVGVAGQLAEWNNLSSGVSQGIIPTMVKNVRNWWRSLWEGLQIQTDSGIAGQQTAWQTWSNLVGQAMIPALTASVALNWSNMWANMLNQTIVNTPTIAYHLAKMNLNLQADSLTTTQLISTNWQTMLTGMITSLITHRPLITTEWTALGLTIESLKIPLATTFENWNLTLTNMLGSIITFQPLFGGQFATLGLTILSVIPQLDNTRLAWDAALSEMRATANEQLSGIISKITEAISAWVMLQKLLGKSIPDIKDIKTSVTSSMKSIFSSVADFVTPNTQSDKSGRNLPVIGYALRGADATGEFVESSGIGALLRSILVPGAGVGGAVSSGSGAAAGASKTADELASWLSNLLKGSGVSVPAFATGGIVYGPTLAMIGEAGAEAVVPLENTSFVDTLASAIGTAVVAAQQAAQSGQESDREIVIQIDGTTLARVMYPYNQQEQQRRGTTAIRTV